MSALNNPRPRGRKRRTAGALNDAEEAGVIQRVEALPQAPRSELEAEWRRLWGPHVPRYASRQFLVRAVAYGLQAEIYGGLDEKTKRLLKKAYENCGKLQTPKPRLSPGTKLLREWHGEMHEVLVLEKGYAWRGEIHNSLSAIARAITGTRWNGRAFFGLKAGAARDG
jgi:hypothetical protein